jgi:hypothetical protein
VTSWVIALLAVYVTLGLSRMDAGKAAKTALVITTFVVSIVVVRTGSGG